MKVKLFVIVGALLSATLFTFALSASKQVKHIVVFKYKPGTTPEQIEQVATAFKALKGKIPGIVSFEYGTNNSPEKLNQGYTHIYLLTFTDAAARDAYLPHAEHKKFIDLVIKLDVLEELFVVDFEVATVK